jgi:flagellar protein FliO/FliZ
MKYGSTLTLMLAAALAAAPAMAQRSVSGTIGGTHAASGAATTAAAETPAAAPTVAPSAAPAAETPAATPAASAPATATPATPAAPPGPLAMTIPTPPAAATSTGAGLLSTSLALLFVLALMLGLAWFVKRFGPKGLGGGNSNVKLVGSLSVGTRERILVVEVGEQWIVVGASPGRMNALATMPRQESGDTAQPSPGAQPGANFAEWFKQTIEKRNGK